MINKELTKQWHNHLVENHYAYNFSWMGRQIIQEPQDIVALQEIMWKVKPDLIIETGIAHGGSLVLSASMLALLDIECYVPGRKVIGIDIDIRMPTVKALVGHPMKNYITVIESSSTNKETVATVKTMAGRHKVVMVLLDSYHSHKHVLAELEAYAPLVTPGSYCVVFDTGIEDDESAQTDKRWGKGDNPKTAVWQYLHETPHMFEVDRELEERLIITSSPNGWLRRK